MKLVHAAVMFVALVGCGSADNAPALREVSFKFVPPWEGKLACAQEAQVLTRMSAELRIGGFDPCPMQLNPVTREITGSCDSIRVLRAVRPMLLVYWQKPNSEEAAQIGFWVGILDQCSDEAANAEEITFAFGDPETSTFIYQQAVFDALSRDTSDGISCERDLERAKRWAKDILVDEYASLDSDCDGMSNLEEACAGSLFPISAIGCL